MKANSDQQRFISNALEYQLNKLNLRLAAICTIGDCWALLHRHECELWDNGNAGNIVPIEFGSVRDWKLAGLNDSHIESVFKFLLRKEGKRL
jgi:hypothetical protein